jgi:hypothetical protein
MRSWWVVVVGWCLPMAVAFWFAPPATSSGRTPQPRGGEGAPPVRQTIPLRSIRQFREALVLSPDDKLGRTYVERRESLIENPPEGEWNGIRIMVSK